VLEAAEARGLATGLVTTTRITHATPASFAAHVAGRDEESAIAAQMIGGGVDVLFGGGLRFFQPEAAGGSRTDGRELTREAAARGYAVATDRAGWDGLGSTPALALLAPDHLAYELDRDETDEPSLAEMTRRALDLLAASDGGRAQGFFLMVEGGKIDHAGHGNDAAAALHDVLAYDEAVAAALAWARVDGQTLVVGVSDHETGGLSLGSDGVYDWRPEVLLAATQSTERMAARVAADEDVPSVLRTGAGLDSLTADELAFFDRAGQAGQPLSVRFAEIVARRAHVGWTTGGHTAVDINLYSFGPGAEAFRAQLANDAVGRALFEALGLEL
jgi:alkaline phosphatase